MRYLYMVMDGRANYDVAAACVLSCIGEVSEKRARKEFNEDWNGHDACLVRYEVKKNCIDNPVVI